MSNDAINCFLCKTPAIGLIINSELDFTHQYSFLRQICRNRLKNTFILRSQSWRMRFYFFAPINYMHVIQIHGNCPICTISRPPGVHIAVSGIVLQSVSFKILTTNYTTQAVGYCQVCNFQLYVLPRCLLMNLTHLVMPHEKFQYLPGDQYFLNCPLIINQSPCFPGLLRLA